MEYPLDRLLIYSDKTKLSEFNIPETELDALYELFITTKDEILNHDHSSVIFFNEVFFYLTCAYDNYDSAENIKEYLHASSSLFPSLPDYEYSQTKQEREYAEEYANRQMDANYYILSFAWIILKKQKDLPKHMRFFLVALEHVLEEYTDFFVYKEFVKKHPSKISISFEMNPQMVFDMVLASNEEWKDVTSDFDQDEVSHIVFRFKEVQDRKEIVELIRHALAETNTIPNSNPLVSSVTHRRKVNEEFLDKLLKDIEKKECQRIEEVKATEKSKDDAIKELQELLNKMKADNKEIAHDRDHWKREYEKLVKRINERNQQIKQKRIPSCFSQLPGSEIINQLVKEGLIRIFRFNSSDVLYNWEGSKKLFGYFVEKVANELSIRKSGKSGNIIWVPFMQAFFNADDLRHEAASAISAMKKKNALMPDGADIIEKAIKLANEMTSRHDNKIG